jgi:methyl-accepting chemotaxis protein
MKARFSSRAGISTKLGLLSVVVFLGIGATIYIGWYSLTGLAKTIRSQSAASTIAFASYDLQQRVFVSWLSLFRLQEDALYTKAAVSDSDYKSALADDDAALAGLVALPVGAQTKAVFKDVEDAFTAFKGDADKASEALARRAKDGPDLFQIAGFSFSLLEAQLTHLNNATRQESVVTAASGSAATAAAARALTLVSIVVLASVLAFVIITLRSITRPLRRLVAAVDAVGSGDLTVAAVDAGGGELGSIAARLDALVQDLRGLVLTVKERLGQLEEAGSSLATSIKGTGDASERIELSVGDSKARLDEQSTAVLEVSQAIDSLARSVEELSGKIAKQSELLTESSASVEQMIANVETVAANAEASAQEAQRLAAEGGDGKARIEEVDAAVGSIVLSSENLGEAARLITEIADRTSLLAMNASIEAAHAGGAGRGFAVVAEEIRKLAEQSTSRALDISGDLARVTHAIESVQAASTAVVGSFASILEKSGALGDSVREIGGAMSEQREGGRIVLGALARLKDITGEITRSSNEMAAGKQSILGQVERLREANEGVVRNDEDIIEGTGEIAGAIDSAVESSSRNAALISEVRVAIDKFRT